MKKTSILLVCLVFSALSPLNAALSVSLKIDRPKVDVAKTGGKNQPRVRRPSVENKVSTSEYNGKITCMGTDKDSVEVVFVEAYYIVRSLSKGKNYDIIEKKEVVGKFEFGRDNPTTQTFTLTSPQVTETETTEIKGGRRNRHTVKTKSGKRYLGVVVRAVSKDKKVLKVVTEPNNPTWIKAAKEPIFRVE